MAVVRYERDAPGDLLHMDTKKLGRIVRPSHRVTGDRRDSVEGAGWEFAHVAIDDHSRAAFVQMHCNERKESAVEFLKAAVAHYKALGIKHLHQAVPPANERQGLAIHADLPSRMSLWNNSAERTAWLPSFLAYYNTPRPHSALGHKPPVSRLGGNNLLQLNS